MTDLTINTLHKFRKLPFKSEYFSDTYTLVARSGKSGVIDQLLQIFPNCVAGLNLLDADENIAYLELYLMFYRFRKGKIGNHDFVPAHISFTESEDICRSDIPFTFFSEKKYLELYSLKDVMPNRLEIRDTKFLQEQRILFNEQLEITQTKLINAEELIFEKELKSSDYFDLATPIDDTGLIKEYQKLGPAQQ